MLKNLKKYRGVIFFYLVFIGMIILINERVKVLNQENNNNTIIAFDQKNN